MSAPTEDASPGWIPRTCTLPTADRPMRAAEFDELFHAAHEVRPLRPGHVSLQFDHDPALAAQAAELAARETACCSFFTFTLIVSGAMLRMDITAPAGQHAVVDALAAAASS